jgi:hypothetical protein
MSLCPSGLLMSALSLSIVLADLYHGRINYIAEHAILGGIVSILFFTMCNYGYEIINWVLLSIVPIYILLKWIFSRNSKNEEDDECEECTNVKKTCGCSKSTGEDTDHKPRLECPAKGGIKLGDACGISRFT